MNLDVITYHDLFVKKNIQAIKQLENALLNKGIVGIKDIPKFEEKTNNYIQAARQFSQLENSIKQRYAPNRDAGQTEGYELGAEWFQTKDGVWQKDDKKASYYAYVPDHVKNRWPQEVDLRTPYLVLGELIFNIGKDLLKVIGLDERVGLQPEHLVGYGRMLHYYKDDAQSENQSWCGAHFDHGVFTGLIPARYYQDNVEVEEPRDSGLYIAPAHSAEFIKICADKSILLFQVGEFGQLISNDRIRATKHFVKKAPPGLERFTFALFYSAENCRIQSSSELTKDERYTSNQSQDGSITYDQWQAASYERYRAR